MNEIAIGKLTGSNNMYGHMTGITPQFMALTFLACVLVKLPAIIREARKYAK
jgi:hypothetical protein